MEGKGGESGVFDEIEWKLTEILFLFRGPEVENWFGVEEGVDPSVAYEWPLLPFMALSDGAHV